MSSSLQSEQFSCSVMHNSLWCHRLQHCRIPCPSATSRACTNSCPSGQWCHPMISSSVVLFFSCLQSFPASGSFPVSQFFTSGGQSFAGSASASVFPVNIQDWFCQDGLVGSPCSSRGLKSLLQNQVQNHQFFHSQLWYFSWQSWFQLVLHQFSSVQSLSRVRLLATPMNCIMSGRPVHHQLPEFTQTYVHWIGDAIQPSHPLLSPSPPTLNLSQDQDIFKWVSSSHHMAKVLEFQLQYQSSQWIPRTDL